MPDKPYYEKRALDAMRLEVPTSLRLVFVERTRLISIGLELEQIEQELRACAYEEGGRHLNIPAITELLGALRVHLQVQAPFVPCDCGPKDDCEKCEGRRWLSGNEYVMAPHPKLTSSCVG